MQALLSKARQQDVLALLSPCLLVFAVPLLLPGVAITTVGLLDNPGFPKYGALHVVGMILLAFSIVLIGAGIAVGCALGKRGSHRVKPMEEEEAAHTYNTHAASDKDGLKLGLQHSSDTRPDVQHSSDTRPDVQHVPPSHPPQGGARPSRHEATSTAVPPPATALAVHDKSGLGQYSVNYCSFQNEVELGQCSVDDSSDENEGKLTSCDLTPKDGMSRAPVLLLTSGISSGSFEVPSTSAAGWQEAQEQLPESSDVAKSAVTPLASQLPENDDAGGQDGRHHKRRLPRALSMDAPRVRADGARNPGAEHTEDKSRCSHAVRDTCDLQPTSPHDSSTSASVADTPVQGPPHWRSSVHGLAITRLPISSRHDEALTSVTAINSSLPAGHRGKATIADTHDSSEATASWTSRELAVVDVTLSLHLRPGEELVREEEEVPQTSLSRFLSPSSESGVGKESHEKMSARRLWSTSCVLQCDETAADVTEAPLAFLEEEPPRRDANLSRALADDSTTLARAHANLDDGDPTIFEEFSGIKTQSSRKHKDWDVSLVSLAQKDMFLSSPAATGPSELCEKYSSEQVELSNYSLEDQSLSIISLEYPSDLNECRETDSKARVATSPLSSTHLVATSPLSSAHLVATSPLSSAHLVAFDLVETLRPQTNHAQRPEQSSQSRETKTAKKKKNKQKKSRKGQGKTVDLKQMPQVADGETPVLSWPLPQTAIL